ncbi:MAG: hypothetical protein JST87_07500 [Bacteroidetes bacterium]|nr:hypothetical protein [Bacteroidota bacterium]MBS1933737.1 hypothetical protein [Bacteroidota bacterium]
MKSVSKILAFFFLITPFLGIAQHIVYSEPEREDGRRTNFEIIGKINGNFLVFKNNRSDNAISIYNDQMQLQQRVNIDFIPDRYINVYFIPYSDHFIMIYEYQKKSIVHCAAIKMDGMAKKLGDPIDLDTTQIGFAANNKIYTTIFSEDKQRIMLFKINSKNPKNFLFTTFLYDQNLELIDRHRIYMPMEDRDNGFTDFSLDNEGTLVFAKFLKSSSGDYISRVNMITKGPTADTFAIRDMGTNERILDELKIKIDNNNKRYILTGFYYKQRRGNIEGVYTVQWDKNENAKIKESLTVFNDELRSLAKSSESNLKMAFNDYFIKQVITKRDGGYILISESEYTTTRGGYFNRWDYMYGYNPYFTPGFDYYGSPFYSPWNRYGYYNNNNAVRYHAENIMIVSFDKDGNVDWSNVIPKSQYDDESDNLISYQPMNTGGELHFLYNQYEGRNLLLNDQSIAPDGKITRYPTLKNLDRGYDFMPRYGRQTGSAQIFIPCLYRNYLCFAKVDF